jgi:hypothetical protein
MEAILLPLPPLRVRYSISKGMIPDMPERFTYEQIKAANELYAQHLPNWRLAVQTLERLRKEDLTSTEISLLAVVAVDSLFATGLRYRPGVWEQIARRISSCHNEWQNIEPQYVEQIAEEFEKKSGYGPVSFFFEVFSFFCFSRLSNFR